MSSCAEGSIRRARGRMRAPIGDRMQTGMHCRVTPVAVRQVTARRRLVMERRNGWQCGVRAA